MKLQRLYSQVRQAIDDYEMIEGGDKIAIGISGGKDSLTLLYALAGLRKFYPKQFELVAISVDLGIAPIHMDEVRVLCEKLDVPFTLIPTQIGPIIFDERKESSPCSLCAKMRKGALNDAAQKLGCTKVALGHHKDDAVETFVMAMFYEGRVNCFSPKSYMEKYDLTIIRPMVYIDEYMIKKAVKDYNYPIIKNPCPADGHTKRQDVKMLIKNLNGTFPNLKDKLFSSLNNKDQLFIWDKEEIDKINSKV